MLARTLVLCALTSSVLWAGPRPILGDADSLHSNPAVRERVEAYRARMLQLAGQHPAQIIFAGDTDARIVALTFDDGPDDQNTVSVLDILEQHQCKATFFFLAENVAKYPEVVRRAVLEGHSVLSHGATHPLYSKLAIKEIVDDMAAGEHALANFSNGRAKLMRPPYGDITLDVLAALKEANLDAAVLWSIDSQDWSPISSFVTVNKTVVDQARPGDIVLLHSGFGQDKAPQALVHIIAGLKRRGFGFATVQEVLRASDASTLVE